MGLLQPHDDDFCVFHDAWALNYTYRAVAQQITAAMVSDSAPAT
jgi:hypothetical protein